MQHTGIVTRVISRQNIFRLKDAGWATYTVYRLYSVRGGGMSLCVTPLLSFLSPLPPTHTQHTYRASNHLLPPSSVYRMIYRTTTARRPSLWPLRGTEKAELGVRSALLFFGRRWRRSKGRRRRPKRVSCTSLITDTSLWPSSE